MADIYPDLREEFHIPDIHVLKRGKTKTKDRATFSTDYTEIAEYDEQGNLVARYMREERADMTGCYTIYYPIKKEEK